MRRRRRGSCQGHRGQTRRLRRRCLWQQRGRRSIRIEAREQWMRTVSAECARAKGRAMRTGSAEHTLEARAPREPYGRAGASARAPRQSAKRQLVAARTRRARCRASMACTLRPPELDAVRSLTGSDGVRATWSTPDAAAKRRPLNGPPNDQAGPSDGRRVAATSPSRVPDCWRSTSRVRRPS